GLSPGLRWQLTSKAGTSSIAPSDANSTDNTIPDDFHLYANIDEVLFSPEIDPGGKRRASPLKRLADTVSSNRLKRSRFFLTANSRSPETTAHGFPRVALWPVASTNSRDSGATNFRKRGNLSAVDKLVRFCSSIDDEEYVFQRRQTELMRVDFSNTDRGKGVNGNGNYGRNVAVYNMLSNQTELPLPGFGGQSIDEKYGRAGRLKFGYGPSRYHPNGIVSDRDQNLFAMFDFIRATNMADRGGNFYGSSRHSVVDNLSRNRLQAGLGQTAGLIHEGFFRFPGAGQWHNFRKEPTPKGIGRLPGISEAALVFICNGQVKPDGSIEGGGPFKNGTANQDKLKAYWRNLKKVGHLNPPSGSDLDPKPGERRIQVALLLEGFTPGHGWGHLIPGVSATIAGSDPKQGIREGNPPLLKFKTGNRDLLIPYAGQDPGNQASFATAKDSPYAANLKLTRIRSYEEKGAVPAERQPQLTPEWAAWGANMGPRAFGTTAFVWDEFVLPPGGQIEFLGTARDAAARPRQQTDNLKIAIFDRSWYGNFWTLKQTSGNAGSQNQFARYDINQTYEFQFPGFTAPAPAYSTGENSYDNYWTNHFRGSDGKGGIASNQKISRLAYARQGGATRLFAPSKDLVRSLVPRHNDYRLIASRTYVNAQHFIPHPDYDSGQRMAHSFTEPLDTNAYDDNAAQAMHPLVPGVQYPPAATPDTPAPFTGPDYIYPRPDRTNNNPQLPLPGYDLSQFTPAATGDFDNGLGPAPDGAYINRPDDLDIRGMGSGSTPYFDDLRGFPVSNAGYLAPNKLIPSAVMFGSLPARTRLNIPWLTLLFRPHQTQHPGNDPGLGLPDHLWLDQWWMPVVEPYAISEPFATAGKINLNHQLLPFTYIERSTGLHAVFKSEKIMAIPDTAGPVYKTGAGNVSWRHHINSTETLKQFDDRFNKDGTLFKTASEICSLWLVPETDENDSPVKLGTRDDSTGRYAGIGGFWDTHRLTGDNVRERPYASIYPRICTRSNTFNVHFIVQAIQKSRTTDADRFDPGHDRVASEFRGSTLIERKIDANDPSVPDFASLRKQLQGSIDQFYSYRIVNQRQFSP
ncbi:MAG: Verru_Chthon cassette protein A, partial [Verrucomicrobiales bacterium]|nr:Verru_Chthon cassette protein A [Verrucomicrobiales bacterium]